VDTDILHVGLTLEGAMEVPKSLAEVGWYKFGPHPGNQGSAVIAGHLGLGEPGIFVDLHKLKPGDQFSVIDIKGITTVFVVRETRTYKPTDRPQEVFASGDGTHLNLITCAGDWDNTQKTLSQRLVVFSDKLETTQL